MLGNSNQQPEHGHLTLERRLNSSFPCTIVWACSGVRKRELNARLVLRSVFDRPYSIRAAYSRFLKKRKKKKKKKKSASNSPLQFKEIHSLGCSSVPALLLWGDLSSSPLLSRHTLNLIKWERKPFLSVWSTGSTSHSGCSGRAIVK